MDEAPAVAAHYGRSALTQTVLGALAAAGKDLNALTPADLAPLDEFHIGGRQATLELSTQLAFAPESRLLDIGSGLGGPSRHFAGEAACHVTGLDLTPAFVETARALSRAVGLADRTRYLEGSALDMPFEHGAFDGAYMLHVGMNIADKLRLFGEIRRVLRPGARLGIYDVMRGPAQGELRFPLPWASGPEVSFVAQPQTYLAALDAAGFAVEARRCRRDFALDALRRLRAPSAPGGDAPPALGLHLIMGPDTPRRTAHLIALLEADILAPVELIARAI